ncbi:OLC1v1035880C1 [Oldenlandia corymbosa var. corymbosa]|uniref:OLC1v1035880C1 n=1 Tax=Oldenlandia corymbosa var. corymbosa TaxID=529605 RepID=A0AAV1CU17_OLDCO|nr:OLC1v1035880C1 [Oldenlandia corymbosa var. corymbosa]
MCFSTSVKCFQIKRQLPELIRPASPTPHEIKLLSDIDDQNGLRYHESMVSFYKRRGDQDTSNRSKEEDPVKVIKAALAETLESYYPFAGRVIEAPKEKLAVDCTGEGVMFIEADADVTLEDFGDEVRPPFPGFDELLYDVPGSSEILHAPLLLVQVTRLRCGGFIFALRFNHAISDGAGIAQFQKAVAEIARGASAPSVTPVWMRQLLNARDPPGITSIHREYDATPYSNTKTQDPFASHKDLVERSFFFGPGKISAILTFLPANLRLMCSDFDVLTACLWRYRTRALQTSPEKEAKVMFAVNARSRFNPPLPKGYYGVAFATPVAVTTVEELIKNPLEYTVELVMKAKSEVTGEYMKSVADLMVLKGRPAHVVESAFLVSDLRRLGFDQVDFGWGEPVYAGIAELPTELREQGRGERDQCSSLLTKTCHGRGERDQCSSLLTKTCHGKVY